MSSEKLTKLESYVERHRPDFDAHEPAPDLWARLEEQLGQPGPGVGPVRLAQEMTQEVTGERAGQTRRAASVGPTMSGVAGGGPGSGVDFAREPVASGASSGASSEPNNRPGRYRLGRYGVAAALALLGLTAVLREARPSAAGPVAATSEDRPAQRSPADAVAFGPASQVLAASRPGADPRLSAAVRGMESYYAAQLSDRQTELRVLDANNPAADWPRELAALDSSYRQLREELPRHPQPEVVLTAMNRNLQIRLDILDQQLQHRAGSRELVGAPSGTLVSLADSREQP